MSGQPQHAQFDELEYTGGGLVHDTSWWAAFVIAAAGTILVTGIAPVVVTTLGAASVPLFVGVTLSGIVLLLLLSELSAMMPEGGGSRSFAYPAWRVRFPRLAPHVNGFCAWAYWLGWFPVAPLSMVLVSFYLADLLGLNTTSGFTPIATYIAWSTFVIAVAGIVLLFIPAYLGIRFGTVFATVLAMLAMIPLTFVAVVWVFHPGSADWAQLAGFHQLDGSGFFSDVMGHGWFMVYAGFTFLLSWNVLAFEAAASYVGECKDPGHDAKITVALSGGYSLFIYTLVPIAFIVVLGTRALSNPALVDPKTMFITFAGKALGGTLGTVLDWMVALALIAALLLSALNAIMGSARGLHQMSADGQVPRWFSHVNKHGVPDHAMLVGTGASLAVVCLGGALEIYSFSNVGYIASFVPVIVGYYLLRRYKPNLRRPFALPEVFKYLALGLAGLYVFFWIGGGIAFSIIGHVTVYYVLGWVTLLAYLPLYWWRHRVEDPRYAKTLAEPQGVLGQGH